MTRPDEKTAFAKHPYMSAKQCAWLYDLINTRVGTDSPEFPTWRETYLSVADRASFESALTALKAMPVREHAVPETATEEGLYLDPATLKVYKLTKVKWDLIVSVYSNTAVLRLSTEGELVKKGKWTKLSAWDSRRMLTPTKSIQYHDPNRVRILSEWAMTDQQKVDYVIGICMFCNRGLEQGISTTMNYGPKCAKDNNLPWDKATADAVNAARKAARV